MPHRAVPLNISTTADRIAAWKRAAQAADLSLSAWVRRHLDRAERLERKWQQPPTETTRRAPRDELPGRRGIERSPPEASESRQEREPGRVMVLDTLIAAAGNKP